MTYTKAQAFRDFLCALAVGLIIMGGVTLYLSYNLNSKIASLEASETELLTERAMLYTIIKGQNALMDSGLVPVVDVVPVEM